MHRLATKETLAGHNPRDVAEQDGTISKFLAQGAGRLACLCAGGAVNLRKLRNVIVTTALMVAAVNCYAERADRDKPLLIEADQVIIDDMHQISTFSGNVRFTQGTMQLNGDKVKIVNYKDGFKQAKAYGNTANFRQKREGSSEYVEGFGERIEYDTRTGTVDFFGQARVKRELDEVRGDHITYSMKTETFQVNGGASSKDAPSQRVRAVLQPKPKADTSDPANGGIPANASPRTH